MKKSPRLEGPGTVHKYYFLFLGFGLSVIFFVLCVERISGSVCRASTDIPLTFLLHRVSERNGKKKKAGFVLWLPAATCPPIWLGHFFSDLGSVNITQKKKSFPSFYAKVERFKHRHQALPITLHVCTEAAEHSTDACWGR